MVRYDFNYMIIFIIKKVVCDFFKIKLDVWSFFIILMMCLIGLKGFKLKVILLLGNVIFCGLRW